LLTSQDPLRLVVPLPLHTTSLTPSSLRDIFYALETLTELPEPLPPLAPSVEELQRKGGVVADDCISNQDAGIDVHGGSGREEPVVNSQLDRDLIYIAIVASDSTVVYYKLSKGIKKPSDVPDE
jgi:hypothetical protein